MPNLLAMAVINPLRNEPSFSNPWSIETICTLKFLIRSLFLGGVGVPPRQRRRQTPCSTQTGTTNYDLFLTSSFDCNFSRNDNQTFNVYMESTLSIYRKGLCTCFQFSTSPRKIFYVNQSVATISDQREYKKVHSLSTRTQLVSKTS